MIEGIGIDLVELERISAVSQRKKRFIERVLTKQERNQYEQLPEINRKNEFLAGRFAAKEAFAKAAGTGIGRLSFQHIEILSQEKGKPFITVAGFETKHIFISISHSKTYAVAQVVITE